MSFQQGLSGLNSTSRAIDVTSNNIANASTVGFKSSSAIFSDMYASSLQGTNTANQVGMGSKVDAIRQSFTQGNPTSTDNPLDLAINGNGFFEVQRGDGTTALTRNGQFDIDANGYITNAQGNRLMGYQTTDAVTGLPTSPETPSNANFRPLQVPTAGIGANPTSEIDAQLNLNAGAEAIDLDADFGLNVPDINNSATYNFTTSGRIFDSLGVEHSLSYYFVKSDQGEWDVFVSVDNNEIEDPDGFIGTLAFDNSGRFQEARDPAGDPAAFLSYSGWDFGNGSDPLDIDRIDFSSSTQFGSSSALTDHSQDGFTDGELAGISVGQNGIVQGRYTNGQTQSLGLVNLTNVRNPNGLSSEGDNLWTVTADSGDAVRGPAGVGLNGVINSGQVEESNVDLTRELVDLIIQQRNYQANAQSIQTQDQLLQTLVTLR